MSRVYEPVTALPMETLPDTFVHPGGYCQNVLATGRCIGHRHGARRAAARRSCSNATIRAPSRVAADRPDLKISIAVDRQLGVILRLVESIGGGTSRDAEVTDIGPDAPLPPGAFDFVFPTGTTMLY